jgi:hypothetical protein
VQGSGRYFSGGSLAMSIGMDGQGADRGGVE